MGIGTVLAALLRALEDRAQVLAAHVLEGDEVRLVNLTELEDLRDVRVRELHRELRLVDEHRDELLVLRDGGQDALDRDETLEARLSEGLRLEDLRHPPDGDPLQQVVLPELDRVLHRPALAVLCAAPAAEAQRRPPQGNRPAGAQNGQHQDMSFREAREALASADASRVSEALEEIAHYPTAESVQAVVELLRRGNGDNVTDKAIETLGLLARPEAIEELSNLLHHRRAPPRAPRPSSHYRRSKIRACAL
jgi:hypothetical protein